MSLLTLPGTIPGLLRRGSPVILATRTYGGSVFLDAARGVVCSDGGRVATETLGGSPVLVSTGAGDLALDLSDPTGRAHAAWWLAAAIGKTRAVTLAYWAMTDPNHGPGWGLCIMGSETPFTYWSTCGLAVEALSPLTRKHPRWMELLPDGSRWVDAEALRLVCLHVAGVSP